MLEVRYSAAFKREFKRMRKRGYDMALLQDVITKLANGERLDAKYKDHALKDTDEYRGVRECHIRPDWLLIYYWMGRTSSCCC